MDNEDEGPEHYTKPLTNVERLYYQTALLRCRELREAAEQQCSQILASVRAVIQEDHPELEGTEWGVTGEGDTLQIESA